MYLLLAYSHLFHTTAFLGQKESAVWVSVKVIALSSEGHGTAQPGSLLTVQWVGKPLLHPSGKS